MGRDHCLHIVVTKCLQDNPHMHAVGWYWYHPGCGQGGINITQENRTLGFTKCSALQQKYIFLHSRSKNKTAMSTRITDSRTANQHPPEEGLYSHACKDEVAGTFWLRQAGVRRSWAGHTAQRKAKGEGWANFAEDLQNQSNLGRRQGSDSPSTANWAIPRH